MPVKKRKASTPGTRSSKRMKEADNEEEIHSTEAQSTMKKPLQTNEMNIPEKSITSDGETGDALYSGISNYEQMRLKNLQDNAEFFAKLGIAEMKQEIKRKTPQTQLKPKPSKKEKIKAPPEPRRVSLRIAKMDPAGAPLPEDPVIEPVEEHFKVWRYDKKKILPKLALKNKPVKVVVKNDNLNMPRKPDGPLEMKSYFGFNSDETEHDELMSKLKPCFKCLKEKTKDKGVPLDNYMKTFSKIKINTDRVAKVVPNRIFSLDIHPSNNRIITAAGDKWGFLGIWDVLPNREHQSDGVVVYTPHSRPINCLRFSPYKYNQLYSCSYDGTLRCCDLEKGVFEETFSTPADEGMLLKSFDFMSADTLLVAQQDGCIAVVDARTPSTSYEHEYQLHFKSLRTISVHPVQRHIFCTSSTDYTVKIWDFRKLKQKGKSSPLDEMKQEKIINSAYFSPLTGNHILSTSMDNRISIFDCQNLSDVKKEHSIVHDNQTGRWLTNFRATWHPRREDLFVVGSMDRPRRIDFYGGNGKKVLELTDEENLGSVCSLNVIAPSQDIVVGANSSGRLHVFM